MNISSFEEFKKKRLSSGEEQNYYVRVSGNSMYPTLKDGEFLPINLVTDYKNPLKIGTIILYKKGKELIIHRITYVFSINKRLFYLTKGDHNKLNDKYIVRSKNIIGYINNKL